MAIRPIDKYPGQTATDPDYPHGKAQNITVDGDGTGTPLEAAWVNDVFGMQQALLDAGGITPSGQPDKVGASDYLAAIRNIAAGQVPSGEDYSAEFAYLHNLHGELQFLSRPYTWTGLHKFQGGFQSTWPLGMAGTDNEVLYTDPAGVLTPRVRSIYLPLQLAKSENTGGNPHWIADGDQWESTEYGGTKFVMLPLILPRGAILKTLTIGFENGAGEDNTASVAIWLHKPDFANTGRITKLLLTDPVPTQAIPTLGGFSHGFGGNLSLPIDNTVGTYHARIGATKARMRWNWAFGEYLDPGPRNG